jgi:hypothetical protein
LCGSFRRSEKVLPIAKNDNFVMHMVQHSWRGKYARHRKSNDTPIHQ